MKKKRAALVGLWFIGAVAVALVWAGAVMADPGASPRNGPVDPAFRTDGRFTSSGDFDSAQGNSPGGVKQPGNSNGETRHNPGKEKPGWLADHGKGFGLGLLEGAVLAGGVLLGAALLAISSPVVGVVAVGVLAGAALYGAFTGAQRFNVIECAINGAIGGISAGLGAAVTGVGLASKAMLTGINMGAGGLASTTSYLFNTPDPTFGGAMAAFGLGAGTAGALTIGGQWLAKTKFGQNVVSALHLGRKGAEVAVEASDELSKKASGMPSGVLAEAAEPVPVATKSQVMQRVAEAEWADPLGGPTSGVPKWAKVQESTVQQWQESVGTSSKATSAGTGGGRLDYSATFEDDLKNFVPETAVLHDGPLNEELVLVQFHSDGELGISRSAKWWTTTEQANGFSTVEEAMDSLALLSDWGSRNVVSVTRIPKGTPVTYYEGIAKVQVNKLTGEVAQGGGIQFRFRDFDPSWVVETRAIPR